MFFGGGEGEEMIEERGEWRFGGQQMGCSILKIMQGICGVILLIGVAAMQAQQPAPSAGADEHLRNGIEAQRRGDVTTAINEYRQALAIEPGMMEARANLGAALAAAGQFDAAIDEDYKALTQAPGNISLKKNLGLAYYKKGDMAHARTEFETVHAARPSDIGTAILLGYADIKLEKGSEAAEMLMPLEAGHESNMDFEYVLAYSLILAGKQAEGLPRMEKVAQATQSADAYFLAGSARLPRREFKEARADLDAALGLNPALPGLWTQAGQARDALGDNEAALPAFEAALRQDPKDFLANLYLGTMKLKQRDMDGARPLLTLALQLQPTMPEARFQMAKLNSMTGNYAEAATALEDLVKEDPKWLDPHVELASLYYKLKRPEDGAREREIVQQIEAQQQKAGPAGK
jgi:tetratricopeptide (TPR) repeat protein